MTKQEFITRIAGYVQKYAPQYGIRCCSAVIAQAILESDWGESRLAAQYHNYFGLKCGTKWTGASVNMATQEEYRPGSLITIKDNFRAYSNMEEGVKGYFEFIQLARYQNLRGIKDPETYLETIKADGYATSSSYVASTMAVINQYNLTQYDKEGAAVYTKSNAINRVIGIAQEEIGYLEKRSNSQLEDKTANAGSNNYTKYWRDVYPAYQGQPWCAAFVSWALMQAFGKATATAMLKHWPYVYCPTLGNLFTKHANPEVGDIVIFYRGGTFAHTGIVTSVVGDRFETVEGNTSGVSGVVANGGGVFAKSYFNSRLPGTKFCRPDWSLAVNWMDQNLVQASGKDFLSLGDNGAAVRKLQEGLVYVGISVGKSGVDGDFGNDTQKAVKTFQARYGLEADGNAGPATQAKLKAEVYKTENAQKGFTRFVGEVQKRSVVHTQARKASPAIEGYAQLNKGNLVDVVGRDGYEDNWYKVCVADQYLGYVWAGNVKKV
ncbi:MAG: glucosaminidase domain-containing protein [Blautia sp.]